MMKINTNQKYLLVAIIGAGFLGMMRLTISGLLLSLILSLPIIYYTKKVYKALEK